MGEVQQRVLTAIALAVLAGPAVLPVHAQKFYPDDRDLPEFVYSRHRNIKGGLPDVFVSLETPVLYFYSERELAV